MSDILPTRSGETDPERRMRETVNRLGGQLLGALDSAIGLRTAPAEAAKARHAARQHLTGFALHAMHSLACATTANGGTTDD